MEEIDNNYIETAIDELVDIIGVKENIDTNSSLNLLYKGDIKGCIQNIATYLGLPIEIVLTYVSESDTSGSNGNSSINNTESKFESSDLVKTGYKGLGSQGITAQVFIPQDIPFYGSKRLNGYPIKVRVSKNCVDYPQTLIAVISHELSHILLAAIGSKKTHNEVYTELTPLLLGFSRIIFDGRKTVETSYDYGVLSTTSRTRTTTYGYFDDKQFNFAYSKIKKILGKNVSRKNTFSKEIDRFEKKNRAYLKYLSLFKNMLSYIESNKNIKINKTDSNRIVSFFNSSFFDEIDTLNQKNTERIEKLKKFCSNLVCYTKCNVEFLNKNTENTLRFTNDIENKINQIKKDLKILIKYLNPLNRIKTNFSYLGIWFEL